MMQPNVKYCFFDLDGTLIDSSPGILRSFNYALDKMGLSQFQRTDTASFIGPPLFDVFQKERGLSPTDAKRAVDLYREAYRAGGILECTLYDGIIDLLVSLRACGIICVLATCKPHEFAKRILSHHGIDGYFDFVSGPEMNGTRNEKSEVIAYAIEQLGITDLREVIMIGDRDNDILGAHACGLPCIGVLWGFGSEEELRQAGADLLCLSPASLLSLLTDQ